MATGTPEAAVAYVVIPPVVRRKSHSKDYRPKNTKNNNNFR